MKRITNILFGVSDFFARLLMVFSLSAVVVLPLAVPVQARMDSQPFSGISIIGICGMWLVVAMGAYAITRRRVFGFVLVLAPAVVSSVCGEVLLGVVLATATTLVFFPPFLLAFVEARRA